MTTLVTALNGAPAVTSATTPTMGMFNRYNAAAGALSVPLPALAGLNVGATTWVGKDPLDASANTVTFTCNGADTFDDATTSLVLAKPGENRTLQVVTVGTTKYWKINTGFIPVAANGKTLTVNNSLTFTGTDGTTFTFPTASDTLVGRASTDTLTNKTISGASNTITNIGSSSLLDTAREPVFLHGYQNTWAVGQLGSPGYIDRSRTFTKIVYIPQVVATGTFTAKLTLKNGGTDVASSTGTSTASATSLTVSGTFAFNSGDMPFVNITATSGTAGLGVDVWLVP